MPSIKRAVPKAPPSTPFPAAWSWFVDELIANFAKQQYSPKESWKDKPFSKEDARFFFKGVEELSKLFTEERFGGGGRKSMVPYFNHPKYRCSYLLYFLPLQAAKFLTLFELHPEALHCALKSGTKNGVLRIADIGAGPATASLALLLWILKHPELECPSIEFYWSDTQASVLEDGEMLAETLSNQFPRLRSKVKIHTHAGPWWTHRAPEGKPMDLTFMGHVLNEAPSGGPGNSSEVFWSSTLAALGGGGLLLVEPAARRSSQWLSGLRDSMIENKWIEPRPESIWGPCLHSGNCPVAEGRDWCHFSIPTRIPGQWFKSFSESLGSERQWVKFSYLWIASSDYPSPSKHPMDRRVISDSLAQGNQPMHLLCEPDRARKWSPAGAKQVWRGDVIRLHPQSQEKTIRPKDY